MAGRIVQQAPFAVQVEIVEGCQLRCDFCGLNGIRGKDNNFKFMTLPAIRRIARQIVDSGWNPRIEFASHGEPTMHPDYHEMIHAFSEEAPKLPLMMTSNGGGLLRGPGPRENVLALFRAGLHCLALDDYDGVKIVGKVRAHFPPTSHGATKWTVERGGALTQNVDCYEYPAERDGSPHARRPLSSRTLVFIEDISRAGKGNHSTLNNHSGAAAPLVAPDHPSQSQRCAKPFRELTVRWDGNVSVCCNDWRGNYKCGNVVKDGLDAVWNGPAMQAARKKLYHGERDFGPCRGCDATSYRVGLLPDKMGKQELPRASKNDLAAIRDAMAGQPYTAAVLRPWETGKARA